MNRGVVHVLSLLRKKEHFNSELYNISINTNHLTLNPKTINKIQ